MVLCALSASPDPDPIACECWAASVLLLLFEISRKVARRVNIASRCAGARRCKAELAFTTPNVRHSTGIACPFSSSASVTFIKRGMGQKRTVESWIEEADRVATHTHTHTSHHLQGRDSNVLHCGREGSESRGDSVQCFPVFQLQRVGSHGIVCVSATNQYHNQPLSNTPQSKFQRFFFLCFVL